MVWTLYLINSFSVLFIAFSVFFSFSFIWSKFLCLLILFTFISFYEIRWNTIVLVLKGGPSLEVSLCSLCLSSWGKVGSEVSVGHNFSKGMLAAITLVGGEAEGRGLEPELGVNQSIFYLQESSPSYRGQDEVLRCWSRSPESWVQLVLFQVYTHLSPSQQWYHHPRAEQCWSKMGQGGCSAWTVQAASQSSRWLLIYCFCECQQWLPLPGSDAVLGSSELHPLPIVHSLRQ